VLLLVSQSTAVSRVGSEVFVLQKVDNDFIDSFRRHVVRHQFSTSEAWTGLENSCHKRLDRVAMSGRNVFVPE
jgi:hypothetical protein